MNLASELHDAFRTNVAAILERRKLSKSDLARMLEVSPAYISQLLSGTRGAGLDTVDKLAKSLGVQPSTLLKPAQKPASTADV